LGVPRRRMLLTRPWGSGLNGLFNADHLCMFPLVKAGKMAQLGGRVNKLMNSLALDLGGG